MIEQQVLAEGGDSVKVDYLFVTNREQTFGSIAIQ